MAFALRRNIQNQNLHIKQIHILIMLILSG